MCEAKRSTQVLDSKLRVDAGARGPPPRDFDHARRRVDADSLIATPSEVQRMGAWPATEVGYRTGWIDDARQCVDRQLVQLSDIRPAVLSFQCCAFPVVHEPKEPVWRGHIADRNQ